MISVASAAPNSSRSFQESVKCTIAMMQQACAVSAADCASQKQEVEVNG